MILESRLRRFRQSRLDEFKKETATPFSFLITLFQIIDGEGKMRNKCIHRKMILEMANLGADFPWEERYAKFKELLDIGALNLKAFAHPTVVAGDEAGRTGNCRLRGVDRFRRQIDHPKRRSRRRKRGGGAMKLDPVNHRPARANPYEDTSHA